jgi:hypothetical protein
MIKIEHTQVMGWEPAIRGMRNPMNSWAKSDSRKCGSGSCDICMDWDKCPFDYNPDKLLIGDNDHELMMKLAKGGPVHAKYRRMIIVYLDITAPLYWWKEFDTYKVGTVANSCSTMHKIHAKEFELGDFSTDTISNMDSQFYLNTLLAAIDGLNTARERYLELRDGKTQFDAIDAKDQWQAMIELLPTSYNQRRTIMLSYEVLANIYKSRKNHKLDEWHVFCDWIEKLPYSEIIIGEKENEN